METPPADILVIDDEYGMREGVRRILEQSGHRIITAECGREGIEKGTAQEFDLYLIDLKMPDIEGTSVLRRIKEKYPEALCIIMTAYASIETAVETTQIGAWQYIAKPFTPEELERQVERALTQRWYVLEARALREERTNRLLELATEQSRLRTIITSIDDGILVINQEGQLVLFNPKFLSLLDIREQVAIGQHVLDLLPSALREQIIEILSMKTKAKAIKQEVVIHPPAKLVIMANTTPVTDDAGRLLGVVSVLRDISDLKQIELLKNQFVNMVAHELKSPLVAIKGYLDIIGAKTLGDNYDAYDRYISRSNERASALLDLINDLLNISRMETGAVRREIEPIEAVDILRNTMEFYQNEMEKRGLAFIDRLPDSLRIDADKGEIQRVFNNLISNAIKYNRPDGSVTITGKTDGHFVRIGVRDTGIGMTVEEKERLFEEFFRAKNALTRQITGTGLGLTIVKRIVESYAGKIEVETEYEKGSEFVVSLPVAKEMQGVNAVVEHSAPCYRTIRKS
jgi:two-component system, OmpR family, phosphate regulon sensor histidine kinase PhoR